MKKYLILFLLLCVGMAGAQSELTLGRAIDHAMENSPALQQMHKQLQQSLAERRLALAPADPTISFMQEGLRSANDDFSEQRQTISQALDFPLQYLFRYNRRDAEVEALRHTITFAERRLRGEVKQHYTRLIHARKIMDLRRRELEIARELDESSSIRLEAGDATELEKLKTGIQFNEAQSDLDEATRAFHEMRYALFTAIGLDTEKQKYNIVFPDSLVFTEVRIPQDSILATLYTQPLMRAREAQISAGSGQVREAWGSFLPSIAVSVYRQDYGSGYDFYGFEAGLSIPLWFPLRQAAQVSRARAEKNIAIIERHATALELKRQIEDAWHGYEASRAIVQRYFSQTQRDAERLLQATLEGYRAGEIDLLNLLDTQRTYLNSQKRYYDALRDYYIKVIELEQYLGRDLVFGTANES